MRFLNGDGRIINKVEQYAVVWSRYANISFNFVTSGDAEIRITFKRSYKDALGRESEDISSWSRVGTDALEVRDQNLPTMNFGWFDESTSEEEFSRTTLHEFGHALGMIHEHEAPTAEIKWDKEAVYSYYMRTQGWDRLKVDQNIFEKYAKAETQFTVYDPSSIMHYPIPAQLLEAGGLSVGWNTSLSDNDKLFISSIYPRVQLSVYRVTNDSREVPVDPQLAPLKLKTGDRFIVEFTSPFDAYVYAVAYSADGSFLVHPLSIAQADTHVTADHSVRLLFGVEGDQGDENVVFIFSPVKIESPNLRKILASASGNYDPTLMRVPNPSKPFPDVEGISVVTTLNCSYINSWIGDVFGLSCNKVQEDVELLTDRNSQVRLAGDPTGGTVILRVAYRHIG